MEKRLFHIIAIARSAFAFPIGTGISYASDAPSDKEPVIKIGASSIWQSFPPTSAARLPTFLQLNADVWADDINDVVKISDEILIGFADTLAVCTNAAISVPQTQSIFEITPGIKERAIREFSQPLEYPMLRAVRCETPETIDPVLRALYTARQDYKYGLAIAHYKAALESFGMSRLIAAFESLCLSAEILAETFVVRELTRRSLTFSPASVKTLAGDFGHYPPADEKINWRGRLYDDIAVRDIFDSDSELFKTVGKATNGFEHGTMPADEIRSIALETIQPLFKKIRSAFIKAADVDSSTHPQTVSWEPIGLDPVREFIDATLSSPNDAFESIGPSEGQLPSLGISYQFTSAQVIEDHLSVARTFSLQPRIADDVTIASIRYGYSSPYNVSSTAKQVRPDLEEEGSSDSGGERTQ